MFSGATAPAHWAILGIVIVLLLGYKKLPDASRAVGRSLRIFKSEMKGMTEDEAAREAAKSESAAPAAVDAAPASSTETASTTEAAAQSAPATSSATADSVAEPVKAELA